MPGRRTPQREYRMISSPMDSAHTLLPARLLAIAEGYAMIRRPNGMPFVVEERAWIESPVRQQGEG